MNQQSFLKLLCVAMLALSTSVFAAEEGVGKGSEGSRFGARSGPVHEYDRSTADSKIGPSEPFAAPSEEKTTKVDLAKGEALYTNGDAARNIIACVTCHGAAGNSTISQNPKLAGQHMVYLTKQLVDFTGPTRNNAVMTMIAKGLTPEDMNNVSAYLSVQVAKPGAAKNKDFVELGKKIYRGGIASINVPACAACHGPSGAGIPKQYPSLAGQLQDYTVAQLISFRSGARSNSPEMLTISHRLSDKEIKAVADYVAGLK